MKGDFVPGIVLGLLVGAFIGGVGASVASERNTIKPCRAALLESCKRDGGNQLDGLKCVKVEAVK